MTQQFKTMPDSETWPLLVGAAKKGLGSRGYTLLRVPGRGRANVWEIEREGKTRTASIRTTKNRWFAFPPLKDGKKWKTLDDVDEVVVAAVDNPGNPKSVQVYQFDAAEVKARFDAAYAARKKAGLNVKNDFGMWVALNQENGRRPIDVGAGLADEHKPIATYTIDQLLAERAPAIEENGEPEFAGAPSQLGSIADVMDGARRRIAALAGVRIEAVKLDLKIEY